MDLKSITYVRVIRAVAPSPKPNKHMTQLIDWSYVNDPDFPMHHKHRVHQRRMHLQQAAIVQRRLAHRARRFQPERKYNGNFY